MTKVERLVFLDPDAPCDDPIDALLNRLDTDDASDSDLICLIHRNSENGNIAIFPQTAKSESEWEKRALAMTAAQQPLPRLADKPADGSTTGRYFSELKRGD